MTLILDGAGPRLLAAGQTADSAAAGSPGLQSRPPVPSPLAVFAGARLGAELGRWPHGQLMEALSDYREPDGSLSPARSTVAVLGTGMFYERDGQLLPTQEAFRRLDKAFVALEGPNQVILPLDLADPTEPVGSVS